MIFIILTRNPRTHKLNAIVKDDVEVYLEGEILEFETREEAHNSASHYPVIQAWGYEVVEVSDPT